MRGLRNGVRVAVVALAFAAMACEADDGTPSGLEGEELGLGEIDDLKADGGWGAALTCKPLPNLPVLGAPQVVVSLDGLTLHLTDAATGYDKVFPIGPGAIDDGASLTPTSEKAPGGVFWLRLDKGFGKEIPNGKKAQPWYYAYDCKYWWRDPATSTNVPVFAGLPFLRLEGAPTLGYAIHGPIDSYTTSGGGRLRRGYVSHGCLRMEAADVLEVAARLKGKKVPVRIQQSVERRADGTAVDVAPPWLMSECRTDADCPFPGGTCHRNDWALRGFCTAPCTKTCSLDKYGYPVSFCVADPEDEAHGICTVKSDALNDGCRRYPGFAKVAGEPRFSQPSVKADVCLPGSDGWIGAPCFASTECSGLAGGRCELDGSGEGRPGFCTIACTKTCPDRAGEAGTFCIADGASGTCAARCARQDDCAAGYTCTSSVPRFGSPSVKTSACL